MSAVFLPVFHHLENGNIFTGSCGPFRYKITPDAVMIPPKNKEVDYAASSIKAEYWHGPLSYEFSEIEGEKVFPMSPEGREEILRWLEAKL
ncbi:MAG: hypothetical protein J5789_02130 [Oscillospiraceae bacterium]|nr:hypothetical protein [Oscillospiraceae bacterium]